jgi:hypothetical protein
MTLLLGDQDDLVMQEIPLDPLPNLSSVFRLPLLYDKPQNPIMDGLKFSHALSKATSTSHKMLSAITTIHLPEVREAEESKTDASKIDWTWLHNRLCSQVEWLVGTTSRALNEIAAESNYGLGQIALFLQIRSYLTSILI